MQHARVFFLRGTNCVLTFVMTMLWGHAVGSYFSFFACFFPRLSGYCCYYCTVILLIDNASCALRVHSTVGIPVKRPCTRTTWPPYGGQPPYSEGYERYSGRVRGQHSRLMEGSRLVHQVMSAIPQSRQAILTVLYGDTTLLRPHYW